MSPSLHICTHMHALVFSKKIADGVFSWSYIISRWRSWIKPDGNKSGETGNLKKQKWRGMELGKKNNHSPPRSFPEPFKKTNLSITRLKKQRNSVPHRNTWMGTLCLKCFTAVKTSVNKNNLWEKKPSIFETLSLVSAKNRVKGKSDYF